MMIPVFQLKKKIPVESFKKITLYLLSYYSRPPQFKILHQFFCLKVHPMRKKKKGGKKTDHSFFIFLVIKKTKKTKDDQCEKKKNVFQD